MYQKEIIYMGLFRDQIKERSAGYLKVDKKDAVYRLELQVKNMSGAITGNFPIRLQSETGWREADMLAVREGNGKWNGSAAEPVLRAEIFLPDGRKIKGESRLAAAGERKEALSPAAAGERKEAAHPAAAGEQKEVAHPAVEQPAGRREKVPEGRAASSAQQEERAERAEREAGKQEKTPDRAVQPIERQEQEVQQGTEPVMRAESMNCGQTDRMPVRPVIKAERISVKPEHTPLYENKWEQLLATYEQIHPYGDNRIYVKLAPKDFIVLRENYQHLVNNSFLLHGFYNYRYLILGREKDFYLGVPGVFYEREKMVALMFGFEAFECEGGRAEEGRFGYYLRKVEL